MVGARSARRAGPSWGVLLRTHSANGTFEHVPGRRTQTTFFLQCLGSRFWFCVQGPGMQVDVISAMPCSLILITWSWQSQEIPATFTEETGWPVFEQCALVTLLDFSKEWPLKLHRKSDVHTGVSAVSVGGGWSKFVADHHLGDGAFLTFEVVDSRTLVVALHACSAIDSSYQRPSREPLHPTSSQHPRGDHVPPHDDIGDTHLTIPGVLTPIACGHRSQFQKDATEDPHEEERRRQTCENCPHFSELSTTLRNYPTCIRTELQCHSEWPALKSVFEMKSIFAA